MSKSKKDVGVSLHKDHATFRVWAPFAKAADVTGAFNSWGRNSMLSEGDGYWVADIEGVEAGQEYKFVIHTENGELYRNDPRALHMTMASGNSVIEKTDFTWTDDGFVLAPQNQQVIYETHIGTFARVDAAASGTFATLMEKLEYLADLGVNVIELMPVNVMVYDRGWGYAPTYLFAFEPLYGTRHEFLELVNAAHQRGIGVIVDVVYNHFSSGDMWQFDGWNQNGRGGIYYYNDWRAETMWGDRPDYGRSEVRQFILDNVRMWMQDCHLDGLRVDAVGTIRNVKNNDNDPANDIPEGWWLLQQINRLARKIKPDALMIGEDLGCNEWITKSDGEGGAGFNAQWEVGFPHVLRHALAPTDDNWRNIGEVADMLQRRFNGDAFRRVVFSESHDISHIRRLNDEISPEQPDSAYAKRRSLLAAALTLTTPGIPMLLQGQEFLQGGGFNDWRELDWEKAEKLSGIVSAYKHLIALRKNQYGNTRGLTGQSLAILHLNEESKVLVYHRWDQGGPGDDVIVIVNFANRKQTDYLINLPRPGVWQVRFNSDWKGYSPDFKDTKVSQVVAENGLGTVTLAPYSVLVLSQD